jgi:diguanylate cyclase (GGDEF)-like protein/putative nucleotidyltransferase with HDIG domain
VTCTAPLANDPALSTRIDAGIELLGQLPVLDQTLVRVRALSDDPDASTEELVAALAGDPNISANLLRFANSGHSASPVRATTLRQAVTLIGRRAVGRMALEAEVCSFFERAPGGGGTARGQLAVHAIQVAAVAAELARRSGGDVAAAHLAGLLHDLGKLVLPAAFGTEKLDAIAGVTPAGPARAVAEREHLGVDHALAGARFAETTGLDALVVEAVALHHGGPAKDEAAQTDDAPAAPALRAVPADNDAPAPALRAVPAEGDAPAAADTTKFSPTTRAVQAANATVAMLNGHPADDVLLNAALTDLGLQLSDLEEVATAAMPAAMSGGRGPAALHDQIARLEHEARTDDLTGLPNRRHWTTTTRDALAERPATVVLVDVDHFKAVNDRHGHPTGDYVLIEIGRILTGHGFAGRLGGDEFALLTHMPDPAGTVAEAILAEVAEALGSGDLAVSVSIGTATTPAPGGDLTDALKRADAALYDAKRAGRGLYRAALDLAA